MWTWALRKVPWRTLLRHAPTIVEAARGYYTATRRTTTERAPERERPTAGGIDDGVRRAVERLEEREVQQAAIVADLAKEVAEMTTAIEILRARLNIALWGTGIALALALASLLVLLFRH